jgi:hypothetical protein
VVFFVVLLFVNEMGMPREAFQPETLELSVVLTVLPDDSEVKAVSLFPNPVK